MDALAGLAFFVFGLALVLPGAVQPALAAALGIDLLPAAANPVKTERVTATLDSEVASVAPGGKFWVALRQQIIPKWHTYWINPGDSGLPTEIDWKLPAGAVAEPIVWPVPKRIPAHWIPNRWSQEWNAMVEVPALEAAFEDKSPEWIVKTAEAFFTSMGRPLLPASFWEKSDLYPVPPGDSRKKNTHASCWDIDLEGDIRSLMSVKANEQWFVVDAPGSRARWCRCCAGLGDRCSAHDLRRRRDRARRLPERRRGARPARRGRRSRRRGGGRARPVSPHRDLRARLRRPDADEPDPLVHSERDPALRRNTACSRSRETVGPVPRD